MSHFPISEIAEFVYKYVLNGDETAFSFFRSPCVAWFGMEAVFCVKQEWDLYMLCR
jgi:hypothetical protein